MTRQASRLAASLLLSAALLLPGCATLDRMGGGLVRGFATGGTYGGAFGGPAGAVVGATVGAAVGTGIGLFTGPRSQPLPTSATPPLLLTREEIRQILIEQHAEEPGYAPSDAELDAVLAARTSPEGR